MKTCPYCSEEIQLEAIKCKHCHEWLDKKKSNDSESLMPNISDSLNKWKIQREEKKYEHIFAPTETTPIEINTWKFYPDYLDVYTDSIPTYDDIRMILFSNHENYTNGIRTKKKLNLN